MSVPRISDPASVLSRYAVSPSGNPERNPNYDAASESLNQASLSLANARTPADLQRVENRDLRRPDLDTRRAPERAQQHSQSEAARVQQAQQERLARAGDLLKTDPQTLQDNLRKGETWSDLAKQAKVNLDLSTMNGVLLDTTL